MNKSKLRLTRGLVIKILVPALIIIGVVVIWFAKNNNELTKGNEIAAEKNDIETDEIAAEKNDIETDEIATEKSDIEADKIAVIDNVDFELNITEIIDLEQLKSYGIPIVIDFGADSCQPCLAMAPVLEKLNRELKGKAIILFVDVWKNPSLSDGYPISLIPTQVLIDKDGNPYVPTEDNSKGMIMYETKDTNEHVYTTHEGGVTEEKLLMILKEMGMEE